MSADVSLRDVVETSSTAPVQLSAAHLQSTADRAVQPKRRVKKNAKAPHPNIRAPNERPQPTGPRVLFIEDDNNVLYSIGRLLASNGFRVDRASDGEVGLLFARLARHDVILLDLKLPKRSGIEVLRQLRLEGVWTPVVILTGRAHYDSALEAGRLGVAGYLAKPTAPEKLMVALRTAADNAKVGRSKPGALFSVGTGSASDSIVTLLLNLDTPDLERDRLARLLVHASGTREVAFLEFIAIAKSIYFLFSSLTLALSVVLPEIRAWLEDASRRGASPLIRRLLQVLSRIEAAGQDSSKVDKQRTAADSDIGSPTLWLVLDREFGVTLTRCRRVILMRKAAFELLNGNEHVRQIAFRLGYTDPSNFDHDFRNFFGVTPTALRRLQ